MANSKFTKGQKVLYLGYNATITNVSQDMMGRTYYSVSYKKENVGKVKVTNIYNLGNEIK